MVKLFITVVSAWVVVVSLIADVSASSVPLVTLTVSGTFEVLPNRTIAIDRPNIDPSSIPIPLNAPSSSSSASPKPTPSPNPSTRPKPRKVDRRIIIGLIAGILGPIAIAIFTALVLHLWAFKIRRDKKIRLPAWNPFHAPRKGTASGNSKITRVPALPPSNVGVPMVQSSFVHSEPTGLRSASIISLSSMHEHEPSSSPYSSSAVRGSMSRPTFYCLQHRCPISPTWICTSIWESEVPSLLRVRTLPPAHQDYYLVARDGSIHWRSDRLEHHMDHVDVVTTGLSKGTHYIFDYRVDGQDAHEIGSNSLM